VSVGRLLGRCGNWLEKFGGHEMAAGLTIREENLPVFATAFQENCRTSLSAEQVEPCLYLDDELTLRELTWDLLRWHEMLQPFGQGNPQPLFLLRRVEPIATPKILKEKHLVLRLRQNGCLRRAIFFGGAAESLPLPPWDVAFRISRDEYEGEPRLQMEVEALRTTISTEP